MIAQAINTDAVREVLAQSHAGKLIFPEVVGRMLAAGVESYFVDLPRAQSIVYLIDGATLTDKIDIEFDSVAAEFSKPQVIAAIRAAQSDEIRWPEFMRLMAAAGVVGYWAYLTGKRVVYFGRQGDMHTEWFPGAQPEDAAH